MTGTPVAKRAEVALRRTKAIEMANQGIDWATIADTLGYASRGAAHTDVTRALKAYVEVQAEAVELHRAKSLIALDELAATVREVMGRRHIVVSNGRVVRQGEEDDNPGEPLEDSAPVLAAVDRLMRIEERRSKLLGLDMPVKVDLTSTTVEYNFVGINIQAVQ